MELTRITDSSHIDVLRLVALHRQEFGEYERYRDTDLMRNLIDGTSYMYFHSVHENGELAGLFIYWDLIDCYYIHLLPYSQMRGSGSTEKYSIGLPKT